MGTPGRLIAGGMQRALAPDISAEQTLGNLNREQL